MNDYGSDFRYAAYQEAVEHNARLDGTIPHCDSRILHDPEECQYCDRPDLQAARKQLGIALTGHEPAVDEIPCEADLHRPPGADNDHRCWGGNKPTSAQGARGGWPEESAASVALYGLPEDRGATPFKLTYKDHPNTAYPRFKPTKEEKAFAPWYMKAVCRNDEGTTTGYDFKWYVKPFKRWLW